MMIDGKMGGKVKRDSGLMDGDFNPNNLSPADRKNWYDSELKRTQLEEKERKLIPSEEVERVISEAYGVISHSLRSIPDNMERDLNITGKQAEYLEININKQLSALEKALSKLSSNEPS